MSKELLNIVFKSVMEGNTDKAITAVSKYFEEKSSFMLAILNEGVKNTQRFKIKDQHKEEYPKHLHGALKAHTQPYRLHDGSGVHMQMSPEKVNGKEVTSKDMEHHVEMPIQHVEHDKSLRESNVQAYRRGQKVKTDSGEDGEISHVHLSRDEGYPHNYKVTDSKNPGEFRQNRLEGGKFIPHTRLTAVDEGWSKDYDPETKDYDQLAQVPYMDPEETAKRIRNIVGKADAAGIELNDGNIVDLIADNLNDLTLQDIRSALLNAGYGKRFPKALASVAQGDPAEHSHFDLGESTITESRETEEYTAPSHWASYFINGDDSGLDPHEKATADEWIDSIGLGMPVSCDDAGFLRHPDSFNVYPYAGDCQTYLFYRENNE